MSGHALSVGTVIELPDGRLATVRFIGNTHFADGQWIGLELDEATGKNDGAVQGERYFDCYPGHGMFVRPTVVVKIVQPEPESKQTAKLASSAAGSKAQPKPGISTGMRKQTGLPPTAARRQSSNAASTPTPVPKGVAALRVCHVLQRCSVPLC